MKLNYSDEDKEIRLSGYDDFVFQETDAGVVSPEPVPDPPMEVAFRDEDEGIPNTQILTLPLHLTVMSVQA